MKRVFIAILPVLLVSGCSTENQQNQQVTAAQPLAQPVDPNQPAQVDPNTAQTQVAAATPDSGIKVLTAGEIQTQFIGVKLKWASNSPKSEGVVLYKKDNTIKWRSGRLRNNSGKWRMEGDKLCTFFPPRSGFQGIAWTCETITRQNDKMIMDNTSYTKA